MTEPTNWSWPSPTAAWTKSTPSPPGSAQPPNHGPEPNERDVVPARYRQAAAAITAAAQAAAIPQGHPAVRGQPRTFGRCGYCCAVAGCGEEGVIRPLPRRGAAEGTCHVTADQTPAVSDQTGEANVHPPRAQRPDRQGPGP